MAAVLLYEVFGFGHAELGALSGRSEAASRQQMHRWLQRLRGRCAPSGGAAAVAMADEEEHSELFLLCSQALAQRDPFNLIAILRTAQPQMLGRRRSESTAQVRPRRWGWLQVAQPA